MRLIHSECGGILRIDRTVPVTITSDGKDIYYGIRCEACSEKLGLLPNVDEATYFITDEIGVPHAN